MEWSGASAGTDRRGAGYKAPQGTAATVQTTCQNSRSNPCSPRCATRCATASGRGAAGAARRGQDDARAARAARRAVAGGAQDRDAGAAPPGRARRRAPHGAPARRARRARRWATACAWTRASGPRTRIEVVTEGVLTRMLQRDPALEGVGLVIFDEFHERSLHADLGLALALESQARAAPGSAPARHVGHARRRARSPRCWATRRWSPARGAPIPVETRYLAPRRPKGGWRRASRRAGPRARWPTRGRRRARLPARRGRDPPRRGAARAMPGCRTACGWRRSTAASRRRRRTRRSRRARRAPQGRARDRPSPRRA